MTTEQSIPISVTREEFENHRQTVSKDIENLASAIQAEGRQRSRDTESVRQDIKSLAALSGRPQYQAMTFAFGIFSFAIAMLVGVWSNGQNTNNASVALLDAERLSHQQNLIDALQGYDAKQDAMQLRGVELSKAAIDAEIKALGVLLNTKVDGGEAGSTARHEAQSNQIEELQRRAALDDERIHELEIRTYSIHPTGG